jgi:putative phosphoribosyl transferase
MALTRLADRSEAGRCLAARLTAYRRHIDVIVLGLPRGGVVVAEALATELGVAFDICNVRKLALPSYPELAVGAVAAGGVTVWNQDVIDALQVNRGTLELLARNQRAEVDRREELYRKGAPPQDLRGKTVIIADDGVATGATLRAAIQAARYMGARRVMAAVGAAPQTAMHWLRQEADEVIALLTPEPFSSVGTWYDDFEQVTDDEVMELLSHSSGGRPARTV